MNVFMTGASGFIGRRAASGLVSAGHSLRCLVRSTSRSAVLRGPGVELVAGDVTERTSLLQGLRGCDCVVHLASLYTMWTPDTGEFVRVNIQGTRNVIEAAAACGVKRLVHISTAAIFGKPQDRPFDEDSPHGEEHFSAYARSKSVADRMAHELCAMHDMGLTSLYPGIVLGGQDDKPSGQYIKDMVRGLVPSTIYNRSEAVYIYVGDVAEAIRQVIERPETVGRDYLLGKERLNGLDYARLVCRVAGVRPPPLALPDWLVTTAAYLLAGVSTVTRRAPMWGLCPDAARTLKEGFIYDGSRAEIELGLVYTPIETALEEAVASFR